jgi:predicted nucleic acid-binding protein
MSFVLDTDIITGFLKNHAAVCQHVYQHAADLYMSAISVYEVERWLLRPKAPLYLGQAFLTFQRRLHILDVNEPVAHQAAMLGRQFQRAGGRLQITDLLIAATALEHRFTLVTHAMPQASSIPGLNAIDCYRP